jgi:hypothetical protein
MQAAETALEPRDDIVVGGCRVSDISKYGQARSRRLLGECCRDWVRAKG